MSTEILLHIGFVDIGRWEPDGDFIAYRPDEAGIWKVDLRKPNALYAFVQGDDIRYIGKTSRSIRTRFTGYCKPADTQQTNKRCHGHIRTSLDNGVETRILVFTPISHLRYADYEIDLAAGLEDSLIKAFNPPWNGRASQASKTPISEDAEREKAEEPEIVQDDFPTAPAASASGLADFQIKLGTTYYKQGFINPGVEASRYLGDDGEAVIIQFADGTDPVHSFIDRTANPNKSVRVVGGNRQIAEWFRANFSQGDIVHGQVVDAHAIRLLTKSA